MRKIPAILGIGLLVTIALGAIACSGSGDKTASLADTPTAISQGTPSGTEPAATEAIGATEPPSTDATTTPAEEGAAVNVNLTEYIVAPSPASVPAGPVTLTAKNIGGTEHKLAVIKTTLAPDALPTNADGSVDEQGAGIEIIDEIQEFPGGDERTLDVDLEAGSYVLICNVVQQNSDGTTKSHYAEGMRAAFTVS